MSWADRQRKFQRYEKELPAVLRVPGNQNLRAVCKNICKSGVYFVSDQCFHLGESVEIRLGRGFFLTGEVVRSERIEENMYGCAVELSEQADETEFNRPDSLTQDIHHAFQLRLKPVNHEAFNYYRRLNRVWARVEQAGTEGITLSYAADLANMERTYFSDFFHKKVGVTFSSWIQFLRIAKALGMLETRNCSVTEVAFQSGYNDLSTFQKAFKKWTSLTPREFKAISRPA